MRFYRSDSWHLLWAVLTLIVGRGEAATSPERSTMLVLPHQASPFENGNLEPEVLDFRYAPELSQTCLGLPDDPFKTILGSDGGLYYDYGQEGPESYSLGQGSFGTRILLDVDTAGARGAKRQSLHSSRVPVVTTRYQQGALEIEQVAWANTPSGATVDEWSRNRVDHLWVKVKNTTGKPATGKLRLLVGTSNRLNLNETNHRLVLAKDTTQTLCSFSNPCLPGSSGQAMVPLISLERLRVNRGWGSPNTSCAEPFRHVVVGRKQMNFEWAVEKGGTYLVAFGLLEGFYSESGKRILEILIEGRPVARTDLVKEYGQNTPVVLTFAAADLDGDGVIAVTVRAARDSLDQNVPLSGLWIFPAATAPSSEEIVTGSAKVSPLAQVDADHVPPVINPIVLTWDLGTMEAGGQFDLEIAIPQGLEAKKQARRTSAPVELRQAVRFWEEAPLPYGKIQVADPSVQGLLESCIRNIYQAREVKNGLPAFQVGPTVFRGLWVVDGAFLLEAATFLGRTEESCRGIDYLLSFQRPDGGFLLLANHWKESGIVLWAVTQQARLTGDKAWLLSRWPRLEKCWEFISAQRKQASLDPAALHAGLLPPGKSDGGLSRAIPEYTNVYWSLAGMRAAIEAAQWLGRFDQAEAWQREFDDFMAAFRKAAQRDMRIDGYGNRCLPITMNSPENVPVQKAQWAFLHGVFPGKLFSPGDELVRGNMAMLRANEREGLVCDTAFMEKGLWTYFGSFYGHAWLWLGDGRKAASTLYAFGNHASPLMCWREEQMPVGGTPKGAKPVYSGDMPHNWASAEFIRLIRHLVILERGEELHLLEGLPGAWARAGAENRFSEIPTLFGKVSLKLRVAADGNQATVQFEPPSREPVARIMLHLEGFGREVEQVSVNGQRAAGDQVPIPLHTSSTIVVTFLASR
jgi:hypothetical protein